MSFVARMAGVPVVAICLNMIVKNEIENLERCLQAVAPHVSCWVIGDTGSTDGTQAFITDFFAARGIPGEIHEFPFENFEQARNEALKRAYATELPFDYVLLDDADMELVVEDRDFQERLDAPGYQLMQLSSGGLRYWNTRLVRREIGAWYHGVTHEYLDVPGGTQQLPGVWYRDHASGSNRVDKFERDIRLLKGGLKKDPENQRYWFYLAQSYQDAGRPKEAAKAYRKRAEMGGWVEEVWTSKLRLARNLLKSGDEAGFVATALAAFHERPSRAEPLYDLARHYRIKGQNELAAMFAERGLEVPRPEDDILFVEDWVYRHGLREEFSIAANYARDPERKARGFAVCDSLALDRSIPAATRELAASNLQYYVRSAADLMPSFNAQQVNFEVPESYFPTNPPVANIDGDGKKLQFLHSCDPTHVLDPQGQALLQHEAPIFVQGFRGGSQLIPFEGGWLTLINDVHELPAGREYWHRFLWFDENLNVRQVTRPFYFNKRGVEFAAGLAWATNGQSLTISYGVDDKESWLGQVAADEVRQALSGVERLPAGFLDERSSKPAVVAVPANGKPTARRIRRHLPDISGTASTAEAFLKLAPFLYDPSSPVERREASLDFDLPIAELLGDASESLPQIHCYYEILSEGGRHDALTAAVSSMRATGHLVKVWSYTPERLKFLEQFGADLAQAADVVPRALFEKIVAGTEIRYFSDVFRYAVLYEHGGLWMDGDVVLLRPFPYRGEHFFNLQWRPGFRNEHFICGNVIYARRHSRHIKALYEQSLELFFSGRGRSFGDVGPKLLSDYIMSGPGEPLRECVFSPMFFNAIDWTESEVFDRHIGELRDYISDERVFGFHMWTARHNAEVAEGRSFIAQLSEPLEYFPRLSDLSDQFATDKNRHTGNHHGYARSYEQIIGDRRLALRSLLEISCTEEAPQLASAQLWATYFAFAQITSAGMSNLGSKPGDRVRSIVFDQSNRDALEALAASVASEEFEVIIDDGSHASHDQQATLKALFPLLADGGWYFIEDLDWQPDGEDRSEVPLTKDLLAHVGEGSGPGTPDPHGIKALKPQIERILFFDSHFELDRAGHFRGFVAIQKAGGSGLV